MPVLHRALKKFTCSHNFYYPGKGRGLTVHRQSRITHVVVLETSFMLVRGSKLSGQRKRQGAKTMARALGDIRLTSSTTATLCLGREEKKVFCMCV